jgi:hypothetical protein
MKPRTQHAFWTSPSETTGGHQSARLYHWSLENPMKGVEIESIDFVSAMTEAAPLLVAITVEP